MNIVILKFGGTSVTSLEKREKIINIVKNTIKNGEQPIVVVSAIGRYPSNYATDTLISLVDNDFKNNNPLAMDLLMSCGETISSVIISATLEANGIKALPLTGIQAGIITDNNFGNASIIDYDDTLIKEVLKDGFVPVVTGFQGATKKGYITTLGRGGSDTTATILGANLNAKRVEIFTDVDGIMTNDPNIDPTATLIEDISYDNAYNMAINGAKVIHEKAIIYAKNKNIPIVVKNILKNNKGTTIN